MSDQTAITPFNRFKNLIQSDDIQERFTAILNERAPEFLASLLSLVNAEKALLACVPSTVFEAAAKAAILRLPIARELGFAWIVPFKNKAEFILGYRGMVQLALRTSQYEIINATEIYQGQEVKVDQLTGAVKLNGQRISDQVIGYASYFKLKNGFEKFLYMSREQVEAHANKTSASWSNGKPHPKSAWATNFDDMGKKTVLRLLLSKWGLMSIQMVDVDAADAPAIGDDDRIMAPSFDDIESIDGEFQEAEPERAEQPEALLANGNGKTERPWPANVLKEKLLASVQDKLDNGYEAKDRAEGDVEMLKGIVASNLEACFAGHKESKDMRHTVTAYLFDAGSTNDLSIEQLITLKRWINARPDSGGEWVPDPLAVKEANAAYEAGLKIEGQQALQLE